MELKNKRVLVLGLGRSGRAVIAKLINLGTEVVGSDSSQSEQMSSVAEELRKEGVKVILGPQKEDLLTVIDLVIVSPGVPSNSPVVMAAREKGITVWSEIEFAFRLTDKPVVAITGTNGKTTTTTLIGEIFSAAGISAAVVGNIGVPLINAAEDEAVDYLIVEVSSFQLETIERFKPHIAVMLNVTEDHLDWHPDFDDYVRSKERIFMNQTEEDYAIINSDDAVVEKMAKKMKPLSVSTTKIDGKIADVFVMDGKIMARSSLRRGVENGERLLDICRITDMQIPGLHNIDNVMAAAGVGLVAGIDAEIIGNTIKSFKGLSHRIELAGTVAGVDFYDDSKATNVDATVKAVNAFNGPLILMVGGRNKGNSFKPLADNIHAGVKGVVGFGESGQQIVSELPMDIIKEYAKTVEDATKIADRLAKPGYTVLFSPACASFDAFKGYAERGEVFKKAVLSLRGAK
jgi:UDP-N-acetylmuramoylalanine--D-glutamate ligase